MDVEYLVLKAVRNGWLADPSPPSQPKKPVPDEAKEEDLELLREIAAAHQVDIEAPQRRSSSRSSSLTPQEARERSSSRHLDRMRKEMQKTPRESAKKVKPPPPPESPESPRDPPPRVQGKMDGSDDSSYADEGDLAAEDL